MGEIMFVRQTVEDFKKGTLEVLCPKMVLRQEGSNTPQEQTGSGVIRQDSQGNLEFVMLESPVVPQGQNIKTFIDGINSLVSGQLMPADSYHSLEAVTLSDVTWKSSRIRVNPHHGPSGSAYSGPLSLIEHEESSDQSSASVSLSVFDDITIPFNDRTDRIVKKGDSEQSSSLLNVAVFSVGPVKFMLTKEDDHLSIHASTSDSAIPQRLETRIMESLQYVVAQTLSWAVMVKESEGRNVTCLHSTRSGMGKRTASPPISYPNHDFGGKWVWPLFGNYLTHVLKFTGDDRFQLHPISAWLHHLRNASNSSIFAKGLALGVAVEGILESEFSGVGGLSAEYLKSVEDMIAHINTFGGDATIQARTLGAVNAMKTTRAKDRLLALQAEGIIRQADVKAWDAIRNRGAHARPPERKKMQEWVNNCYRVEVLINHLIFKSIGYAGPFTDYGTTGWPVAQYPSPVASNP
jgi:hypothetical protein